MRNARRFALIAFVVGVLGVSIGLTTTQSGVPAGGTAITVAASEPVVTPDAYLGQGEFDTTGERVTCIACLSIPCNQPGGPASCSGWEERDDPSVGTGCSCRTCNGHFNCWKN